MSGGVSRDGHTCSTHLMRLRLEALLQLQLPLLLRKHRLLAALPHTQRAVVGARDNKVSVAADDQAPHFRAVAVQCHDILEPVRIPVLCEAQY